MKTLFIDACPRRESRTRRLAETLLEQLSAQTETLCLAGEALPQLTEEALQYRTAAAQRGDFSDGSFAYARQFAQAEQIVIAAPFWDLSFPAILKQYLEAVTVAGLTFRYDETGVPRGLCRAKALYYVTTAGGPILQEAFGYGYVQALARGMFGIAETHCIRAEGLDIAGNDAPAILSAAQEQVRREYGAGARKTAEQER